MVQFFQNDTRLNSNDRANGIKLLYFVHIFEVQNDLIKNGDASSNQASISSLRNNSQFILMAVFEYFWNLLGSIGAQQQFRISFDHFDETLIMTFQVTAIGDNLMLFQYTSEMFNIFLL